MTVSKTRNFHLAMFLINAVSILGAFIWHNEALANKVEDSAFPTLNIARNAGYEDGSQPSPLDDNYGMVNLAWTAPGDDSLIGRADHYVIKYSPAPLDNSNWDQAVSIPDPPAPLDPGQNQEFVAAGFYPGEYYYLGIKTYDDAGNISRISNVVGKYASGIARPELLGASIDTSNVLATLFARTVNSHYAVYYEFALDTCETFTNPRIDIALTADTTASVSFGSLQRNINYFWRCRAMAQDHSDSSLWSDYDSFNLVMTGIPDNNNLIPADFSLEQSYPNPFNASATIKYALPRASHVTLEIYDLLGKIVAAPINTDQQAGNHQYIWQADAMPSGTYLYKIKAGEFEMVRKAVLIK